MVGFDREKRELGETLIGARTRLRAELSDRSEGYSDISDRGSGLCPQIRVVASPVTSQHTPSTLVPNDQDQQAPRLVDVRCKARKTGVAGGKGGVASWQLGTTGREKLAAEQLVEPNC